MKNELTLLLEKEILEHEKQIDVYLNNNEVEKAVRHQLLAKEKGRMLQLLNDSKYRKQVLKRSGIDIEGSK